MPPKAPVRRQRVESNSGGGGGEQQEEFSDLPQVSLARFTSPQTHTLTIPIELPSAQLGAEATYNIVAAKVLFQPAKNFGIVLPGEVEGVLSSSKNVKSKETKTKTQKQEETKTKNEDEDEDDEINVDNLLEGLHSAAAARVGAGSFSQMIGRQSAAAPNLLPRRIICGIVQIVDVKPVGTKNSGRGDELFKLNVEVTVQTIRVLSDGFCSAMVCRQQHNQQQQQQNSKKQGQSQDDDDGESASFSGLAKNANLGLKLSFFVSKENFSSSKKKKNNNNKNQEQEKEEEQDPEDIEYFTASVPFDAPHVLLAAKSDNPFGGKKVLVSIENSGAAWRAHLGVTPGNGSGGKFQSGGKWETHMPWTRSEKKTAWNFRAPPPSQRTNENRIVIKFVKDSSASSH
jgi:hypothetical protein